VPLDSPEDAVVFADGSASLRCCPTEGDDDSDAVVPEACLPYESGLEASVSTPACPLASPGRAAPPDDSVGAEPEAAAVLPGVAVASIDWTRVMYGRTLFCS
jgi:hypothetical protein